MKITNQAVIQSGERELIDAITADLDWTAVEALFLEQHRLPLGEDVTFKNGDMVVHENRVAYLLEFEVKVPLSMLLDRNGSCIGLHSHSSADATEPSPPVAHNEDEPDPEDGGAKAADPGEESRGENGIRERVSEARAELSGM